MDKVNAFKNLVDIYETLKNMNIQSFLCCGTLLGSVREKNFISHDDDVDLGILADNFNYDNDINTLKKLLNILGFKYVITYGKINDGFELKFSRYGINVDLFFFDKVKFKRNIINLKEGGNFVFEDSRKFNCINFKDRLHPFIYDFPDYVVETLTEINFLGHNFLIPKYYDEFLSLLYGNWTVVHKYEYGTYKNSNLR